MAAQSTAYGKRITTLAVFGRRLFIGYGDLAANTGPIHALSLDLDDVGAGWTDEHTLLTEQTGTMRVLDGRLVVPYWDPRGGTDTPSNGQAALRDDAGVWTVVTNVTPVPVHVLDVAKTAEGWWLFGSSNTPDVHGGASIWRSTDNMATWTHDFTVPTGPGWDEETGAGARFNSVQTYSDGTLVTACLGSNPEARAFRRAPAGAWTEITDADVYDLVDNKAVPFTYDGHELHVVAAGKASEKGVVTVTAQALTDVLPDLLDYTVSVGDLFGLGYFGEVYRCTAAGVLTQLYDFGIDADLLSIAVDPVGGWIYMGTTDARVVRAALPT